MMSLTLLLAAGICGLLVFGVVIAVFMIWAQNRQIGEEIDRNPTPPRPVGMEQAPANLEAQIQSLVQAGNKIEAIKVFREATGLGLKDAKDAVEALQRGQPLQVPAQVSWEGPVNTPVSAPADLEAEILALARQGNKLAAIARYRSATGSDLKTAKEAVEALERGEGLRAEEPPSGGPAGIYNAPITASSGLEGEIADLLRQGRKLEAIKVYRQATNLGLAEAKDAVEAIERGLG